MSKLQPIITLGPSLMEACRQFGDMIVKFKQEDRGRTQPRAAALVEGGIETDPQAQAEAKMCECALAIWFDLDAKAVLNWSNIPDSGHDLQYKGVRFDTKGSGWSSEYLTWPRRKNHIYDTCEFDLLVFVQRAPPHFKLNGYTSKNYFLTYHKVAPRHHKLWEGTWHMHERLLWNMADLMMLASSPTNPQSPWKNDPGNEPRP
jgi:hypothetical protein